MRIIIFIFCILAPIFAFGQNCPSVNFTPLVEINNQNLEINQQKNVNYLHSISTNPNHNPIGLFRGYKSISIQPYYQIFKSSSVWCAAAASISLKIDLKPIIYISQEAQAFTCTYNRVYEHEMTHFRIEMNALNKLKLLLNKYLNDKYKNNVMVHNEAELTAELNKINAESMKYISQFIEIETLPFHESLDTPQNYQKESKICSYEENMALMRLIESQK